MHLGRFLSSNYPAKASFMRGGTLIGTAAISGLPDVEDHKMVVSALLDLLKDGAR